ncbi:MAG: SLBB domain-containing protein [Rhodothermales bacterium]
MVVTRVMGHRRARHLILVGLILGMIPGSVHPAQSQNRMGGRFNDPTRTNPIQMWQQRAAEADLLGLIALEGSLDASEYRVGPGDVFSVSTGGEFPILVAVPVSADGNLVLPEAGSIPAAGRTLADVQRDANEALHQRFQNVQVEVSLTMPRQFYVHITGAVPEPGRFLTMPLARVDDALQQAFAAQVRAQPDPRENNVPRIVGSATSLRPAINPNYRPALRNVRITHRDGSRQVIDLIRYYTTGDTRDNPYLLDGDVVMVPSYHIERDAVRIGGEVAYPGTFDFRPGDTALDLLGLAADSTGLAAIRQIRLTRSQPDGTTQTTVLDMTALRAGEIIPLQPGDFLNVLPEEIAEAAIQGRVQFPGTYRIEEGRTTLHALIEMAGGLKPDADVRGAFIERRKTLSFQESGRTSDLDFFSRAFLASSRQANRVVVNIEEALQNGGEQVVLYDGDRVIFPRDEATVYVTGNVPQPGYIAFVEGQTARYYIDQAGGAGPLTRGIYVFEGGTGQVRTGDTVPVRSGDTVFVDREDIADSPELAQLLISDRSSRRQSRMMTTQTVLASITAAISIIATLKSFGAFD